MPYPFENAKAKHDLVSVTFPQEGENLVQAVGFPTTQALLQALNNPQTDLQTITPVYSYPDAPEPALSRSLTIIGVADHSVGLVRRAEDLLRPCTIATKKAVPGAELRSSDRENAIRMGKLLRRLRDENCVAVIGLDKFRRFGILMANADMVSRGDAWEPQDFAATLYTGQLDEVTRSLSNKRAAPSDGYTAESSRKEKTSVAGDFWKPPLPDPDPAPSSDADGMWKPTTSSTEDDAPFGSTTNDGGWGTGDSTFAGGEGSGWGEVGTTGAANPPPQDDEDSAYHADKGAAAAAKFYDSLKRDMDTRANSKIFHMRSFNGWVKATQIQELNPITSSDRRSPLRVLDLACGKGGDLGKWTLHSRGIGNYVGLDVARKSLADAALRARKMRSKLPRCTFTCADLGSDVPGRRKSERHHHLQRLPTWSLHLETAGATGDPLFMDRRGGGVSEEDKFDVVSIQFAIHYMMQTRTRARRFFQTVSQLLDIGGIMIATTIDARVVVDHVMEMGLDLSALAEPVVISVGAGACRITFEPEIVRQLVGYTGNLSNDAETVCEGKTAVDEDLFGLEYKFMLVEGSDHSAGVGDAVNLEEWLIPIPVLQSLACEAGLELVYAQNFHEFFEHRSDEELFADVHNSMYKMRVLNRNGSIFSDEYEISRLYCALQFRKVRESLLDPSVFAEENGEDEEEEEEIDPTVKAKFMAMALMKAKKANGTIWSSLSAEQRSELIDSEIRKLVKG